MAKPKRPDWFVAWILKSRLLWNQDLRSSSSFPDVFHHLLNLFLMQWTKIEQSNVRHFSLKKCPCASTQWKLFLLLKKHTRTLESFFCRNLFFVLYHGECYCVRLLFSLWCLQKIEAAFFECVPNYQWPTYGHSLCLVLFSSDPLLFQSGLSVLRAEFRFRPRWRCSNEKTTRSFSRLPNRKPNLVQTTVAMFDKKKRFDPDLDSLTRILASGDSWIPKPFKVDARWHLIFS